jgi:uncharacterized membrane protein YfcA
MSNRAIILLVIAAICLAVGLAAGNSSLIVDGLGKAMFGVFMILFFIVQLFGEKEA